MLQLDKEDELYFEEKSISLSHKSQNNVVVADVGWVLHTTLICHSLLLLVVLLWYTVRIEVPHERSNTLTMQQTGHNFSFVYIFCHHTLLLCVLLNRLYAAWNYYYCFFFVDHSLSLAVNFQCLLNSFSIDGCSFYGAL